MWKFKSLRVRGAIKLIFHREVLYVLLLFPILVSAQPNVQSVAVGGQIFFHQTNLLEETFGKCPPKPTKQKTVSRPRSDIKFFPPEFDELDLGALANETSSERPILETSRLVSQGGIRPISRVAIWGDSHSGMKVFTDAFLTLFDVDKAKTIPSRFLPANFGLRGAQNRVIRHCVSTDWEYRRAYLSAIEDNRAFPITGVSMRSRLGSSSHIWVELDRTPVGAEQKELILLIDRAKSSPGTRVRLTINDASEFVLEVDRLLDDLILLKAALGVRFLKLEVLSGSIEILGFVQTDSNLGGASIDVFNMPGATFKAFSRKFNTDVLERGLVQYDLIVFQFGTNEANNSNFSADEYRREFRNYIDNALRVFPQSMCVLLTPPDRGVLVKRAASTRVRKGKREKTPKGELLRYSVLHSKVSQIQREEGAQRGCFVWDGQAAMGGGGSVYSWFYSTPRLMSSDLTHLSVEGYQRSSIKLASWLRETFADTTRGQSSFERSAP